MRKLIALVAVLAAALTVTSTATSRQDALPRLKGVVGPGFTITLKRNGVRVRTLRAGTYRLTVADKSSIHNFELERTTGAEIEKEITHVGFVGTRTVKVRLTRGKWKYYCKPHEDSMVGRFTVR